MDIFGGRRFLVYGDGVSGKAAQRAIKKRGGRADIFSDRQGAFVPPPERPYYAAVISPGVPADHPIYGFCAKKGIRTVGEAELGFMLTDKNIIAVTGTNGKTTVTRLISSMLGVPACGNIGYPLTAAVDEPGSALAVELSSFQLFGHRHIAPHIAVITNIEPDHIDRHGSFEAYCRCKCSIADNMTEDGFLVLGDDVKVGSISTLCTQARIVRCSSSGVVDGAYVYGGSFWFCGERICSVDYLRLPGAHNIKNALCAIAAAKLADCPDSAIITALSTAESAPHRLAPAGEACGKRWIDDSKSTNIPSTIAAVDATAGDIALILGGRNKGLSFLPLFSAIKGGKVKLVIAYGECAGEIAECGKELGTEVVTVDSIESAVSIAAKSDCEVVLLSPACASFDMFDGYGARGDAFKRAVASLGKKR